MVDTSKLRPIPTLGFEKKLLVVQYVHVHVNCEGRRLKYIYFADIVLFRKM